MAKIDAQRRADVIPPVVNGELVPVASVVQITHLTVAGPYEGDFQIVNSGRLIVGEYVDVGARVVISQDGLRGWNNNNVNTFSLWTRTVTEPSGATHAPGDLHLGNIAANYLQYNQTTGTLGLYTPQGAGFIAQRDGTLQAGHATGAHMLWNAADESLQVRYASDVKINLGADGNASFDGTIYANGGRIYGTMAVDDVLRAGDVDGPAVYLGKFTRDTATGTVETSEIIATNESNMPWFHVVAGGETLTGYFHLGGTGDYAQHLSYDGGTLEVDGTIRARNGTITLLDVTGKLTFGGGRGQLDNTGLKLESSQSGDDGYNVIKWIDDLNALPMVDVFSIYVANNLGQTAVTLSGPAAGSTPAPGISASTVTVQPIADTGGNAEVRLEPKVNTTVSTSLIVSDNNGVLIDAVATKIGDGGTTNYSQFDSTGHLTFVGTAKPWNDILIEPVARTTGTNAPTFEKWYDDSGGTSRGVYLYSFDDAASNAEKEVFFTLQMSHAWDGGNIQFHVHWIPAVSQSAAGDPEVPVTPRWGLEYVWKEPGGTYGDTTIVYGTGNHLSETSLTAHKHYITIFSALSPGSTADDLSSVLIGRIFRNSSNAADTYNTSGAKCGLLYIDAHYQLARIGSTDEYSA